MIRYVNSVCAELLNFCYFSKRIWPCLFRPVRMEEKYRLLYLLNHPRISQLKQHMADFSTNGLKSAARICPLNTHNCLYIYMCRDVFYVFFDRFILEYLCLTHLAFAIYVKLGKQAFIRIEQFPSTSELNCMGKRRNKCKYGEHFYCSKDPLYDEVLLLINWWRKYWAPNSYIYILSQGRFWM